MVSENKKALGALELSQTGQDAFRLGGCTQVFLPVLPIFSVGCLSLVFVLVFVSASPTGLGFRTAATTLAKLESRLENACGLVLV